jgi:hypothetical protein
MEANRDKISGFSRLQERMRGRINGYLGSSFTLIGTKRRGAEFVE